MMRSSRMRTARNCLLGLIVLAVGCSGEPGLPGPAGGPGDPGPPGPEGPPGGTDPGVAVEACLACHAAGAVVPVGDITLVQDAHATDLDPDGPATASGYRRLDVDFLSVDVTGSRVVLEFDVRDEGGAPVPDLFASDGRFNVARLKAPADVWDPVVWESVITSERFTTAGGLFEPLPNGRYRYSSVFDPQAAPISAGESVRVAVQLSKADLPPSNAWCDFDADLVSANDCTSGTTLTRDIVQTATCNGCHGVTTDTQLAFHGGGRTQVEYCVTCHNPDIGETDFTRLVHKIHYGSNLSKGFRGYSHVSFPRDIDDCTTCHQGAGVDVDSWFETPTREACGSCHDAVNFDTGENHGTGGVQPTNEYCASCHPAVSGPGGAAIELAITDVHRGMARAAEGALYSGAGRGFSLDSVTWDAISDQIVVQYSVTRDVQKALLESDPEWTAPAGASRLALTVGWATQEYSNEGSNSSPTPAQPVSFDALDVGGAATALGGGDYEMIIDVPSGAFDTVTVGMEGHPAADLDGDSVYTDRIAVRNVFAHVSVEQGQGALARRSVVDVDRCNACHDSAGNGLSVHGNNRTSELQVCVVCHNGDATDISQRPADVAATPDGKREEAIDIKRMIHQIHSGQNLDDGIVLYGFGGSVHDFSSVGFTGNLANCETCHLPGTYGTEQAGLTLASSIDTGDEVTDPSDDLNISPVAAVCSSCHDGPRATEHMIENGASFRALDENIN